MKGHTHETLQMWIATRSIDTEILYIILHNLFERDQENPVNVYIKKYSTFLNYVILYFVLLVTYIYTVVYHFKYTTNSIF